MLPSFFVSVWENRILTVTVTLVPGTLTSMLRSGFFSPLDWPSR